MIEAVRQIRKVEWLRIIFVILAYSVFGALLYGVTGVEGAMPVSHLAVEGFFLSVMGFVLFGLPVHFYFRGKGKSHSDYVLYGTLAGFLHGIIIYGYILLCPTVSRAYYAKIDYDYAPEFSLAGIGIWSGLCALMGIICASAFYSNVVKPLENK